MSYTPMKFRVKDEEHSKMIQQALFELGPDVGWAMERSKEARYAGFPYLYLEADGKLLHGSIESTFQDDPADEYQVEQVLSYKFTKVEVGTMMIGKDTYRVSDINRALTAIGVEPVG